MKNSSAICGFVLVQTVNYENTRTAFKNDFISTFFGACIRYAVYHGTSARNRQYALSYAYTRIVVRIYMRLAMGIACGHYITAVALAYARNASAFSDGGMYGV